MAAHVQQISGSKKSNAHLLLQQPASQPRVVLDELLVAQAVLDRVGYVTHPKNGVEQMQRINKLKQAWMLTGLCCVMRWLQRMTADRGVRVGCCHGDILVREGSLTEKERRGGYVM